VLGEVTRVLANAATALDPRSTAASAATWSATILDTSPATGAVPVSVSGALRPEMSVNGGSDVLLGGTGDDLLIGSEGSNLLVGGYATRSVVVPDDPHAALDTLMAGWGTTSDPNGATSANAVGDDYFLQTGNGGEGGGTEE